MFVRQFRFLILIALWLSVGGFDLNVDNPEECAELCASCGGTANFVDEQCDCQVADDDEEGAECVVHFQRELDSNPELVDDRDLMDEERFARCALASRRLLRKEDANRVATYFLNGGPAAGVSHFIPVTFQQPIPEPEEDCDDSSDDSYSSADSEYSDSDNVGAANPLSKAKQPSENTKGNITNNPAYGTAQAPVHALLAVPTVVGSPNYFLPHEPYRPITRPLPLLPRLPRPRSRPSLISGLLHPQTLQNIPQHLLRFANLPVQALTGLNNLIPQGITPPIFPLYNTGEPSILGASSDKSKVPTAQFDKQDDNDETENDKFENRPRQKAVATRPRIGSTARKQNAFQGQSIVGAPAPVYQQPGQISPLLNIMNPPAGGYVLQLIPQGQNYPTPNTIVGYPNPDNRPLCREPTPPDSPVPNDTNDSADDTDDESNSETDENDVDTESKVNDD